jgi:fused signal recognition particle receptor
MGLFDTLSERLKKTSGAISSRLDEIINYYKEIDDDFFDDMEDVLISSDMGIDTSHEIIKGVKEYIKTKKIGDVNKIKSILQEKIAEIMDDKGMLIEPPMVIIMVGVNGTGKTTSAGKLAAKFTADNKRVALCAADTFRAAAIEQLTEWSKRANVPITKAQIGSDAASVVYDAITSAKSKNIDILICDTAGRLHNKKNLMMELEKISRTVDREYPEAKKETLLVIDATTGQNAISQAKLFSEAAGVTGIILTKLDGTARGGVAVAVKNITNVPVYFIGIGEGVDDLEEFDASSYAKAIIN